MALLLLRLRLNGWRTPRFSGADNSAAFCATARCRALSYSYLYWLNMRLLLLPDNMAHDWSRDARAQGRPEQGWPPRRRWPQPEDPDVHAATASC